MLVLTLAAVDQNSLNEWIGYCSCMKFSLLCLLEFASLNKFLVRLQRSFKPSSKLKYPYSLVFFSLYRFFPYNSSTIIMDGNIVNPSRPNPGQTEKINLNFYFHFFAVLERFYKTFRGTTNTCENKNLSLFSF